MITQNYSDLTQLQKPDSYMDLNSLQDIRQEGKQDKDAALRKIADQFESLFLQIMLKSMRSANDVFAKDNPLNSFEMNHHKDMLDKQLGLSLSGSNSFGLAEAFYRQMQRNYVPSKNSLDKGQALASVDVSNDEGLRESHFHERGTIHQDPYAKSIRPTADTQLFNAINSPQEFVQALTPYAKAAAKEIGVDYRVLIAQSALETGWGKYIIKDGNGNQSFNLFNIKADRWWKGDSVTVPTTEYVNGVAQKEIAGFRRYNSIADSFKDYLQFLSQPRYKKALTVADNAEQFVNELHRAGYATDPKYSKKINSILNGSVQW